MAVASEGFSIREYASKMRSENVGRSWPFGGDVEKKQIESILPPITVTKFRWWLHELESARSCRDCASDGAIQAKEDNKGAEMLEAPPLGCAVCGGLGAPSISATLTSHNGNCLVNEEMKHRAKTKSKAPKKRSIMEIFAVAAQIESATNKLSSNRVGEASSSRSSNPISSKSKKNKTKKNKNNKKKKNLVDKTRLLPVDNRKFKNKKKKKKKMGRNHHHQHQDALITLENAYKLKQKIASNWTRNLDGSSDGMYTGRIFGNSVCRKKRQLKSSSLTKHEASMPSKFCKRQDKLHVPVRGILKKQGKLHLNSDSRNIVHLEKHVKFLDNVEVQVSPQNSLTSIQHSDGHARFSGADKLIGSDEEFSLVEVTSGDDEDTVPIESGNRAQVTLEKEHITETRNQGNAETENYSSPQHASPHHCRNSSLTESISTRQVPKCCKDVHTSIKGKSVVIDDSTTTENSRFLTQIRGTQGTNTNIQMPESPLACNIVGPSHGVCGMSTIQSPRTSSQLTPSRLFLNESLNRSFYLQSPPAIEDTSARPVIYQQLRCQRPMNLFNGAFTCPDQWNPRPCSLTEECTYKDLWGLPLNSRGELIQMNSASNSNFVLNQLHSSGMVSGSSPGQSFTQPIYAENDLGLNACNFGQRSRPRHLDLFPMHNCDSRGGPSADVFWQNPERHVSPSCSINTDLNLVNVSFDMCGHHGYDSVQHQRELNQGIPPMAKENRVSSNSTPLTMRLMGKDVAVARSNTREPEDENIWTDKEIIIEHLQPEEDPFTQSTFQKSQGSANLLFEHQKNMQCKSLAKPHHSLLLNPYVNWHPDSVPQRDRFHFTGSSDHEWQPVSQASFNFTSLREPLVSEPRLALPSLPRGSSQCIHWVPKQNYHPNPPCPRASGFDFPFVRHDCGEYVQHASLFENPFKDVPPWLHPSDQGRSMPTANSLVFPDGIQRNYLSQTPPNMFNSSVTFTTYSPVDPPSHWRSPFGPSPAVRPRLLEVDPPSHWRSPFGPSPAVRPRLLEAVPGIEPVSTSKVNYGSRIESNDRIMSPAFGVMTPELSARTRKRPAVKSVDPPMKLGRMPNLGLLKHRSIDRSPMKETFFHEVERSGGGGGGGGGAIRLDSSSGKSSAERLPDGNRAQNNGQRYFTGTKKFSTTRPGPAKLSAGGRHVLKSTQATDQDSSRLIHSMVPPSEVPDCIMVPESQARSTKTYKI